MQVEWYNIWLEALDNFGKLHQGGDTTKILEDKALQVCIHQISLHIFLLKAIITGYLAHISVLKICVLVFQVATREGSRSEAPFGQSIKIWGL